MSSGRETALRARRRQVAQNPPTSRRNYVLGVRGARAAIRVRPNTLTVQHLGEEILSIVVDGGRDICSRGDVLDAIHEAHSMYYVGQQRAAV